MAKDPAVSSIECDCNIRADVSLSLPKSHDSSPGAHDTWYHDTHAPGRDQVEAVARRLSVHEGAPWGLDRIDTNGGAKNRSYDDGDLTGKGVRVYIVDTGVQGSHVDFGGRVVNGHTVRAADVAARIRPPAIIPRAPASPHHPPPLTTPSPLPPPLTPTPQPSPSSQAFEHTECASCQAVNGILPADGTGCNGHGTHVASTVGGLKYGVAKAVTIVPAFSCFKFLCNDGTYRCGSGADIAANLECAPRHTCAPRRRCRRRRRPQCTTSLHP